jgi:hypothetical protein
MGSEEYGQVSLETIGHGVAAELFDRELVEVLKNIADPNTDPTSPRKIILTVTIAPNDMREEAAVQVKCVSRVAGVRPHGSTVFFAKRGGKMHALQHNFKQQSLLDAEDNVVPFEEKKDA